MQQRRAMPNNTHFLDRTTTSHLPIWKEKNNRIKKFRLYNLKLETWSPNIVKPPILLTELQVKNWRNFKAQYWNVNELYIWHPANDVWIPMYSHHRGFILLGLNFIEYEQITYEQLTCYRWQMINKLPSDRPVRQLLRKHNLNYNQFVGIERIKTRANQHSFNVISTIAGCHYYTQSSRWKSSRFCFTSWTILAANDHCIIQEGVVTLAKHTRV